MPTEEIAVTTLLSGDEKITVSLRDGTSEVVTIPLVPLRHAMKYITLMNEQSEFIEFICRKSAAWVDSLTDDSAFAIDALARKINDPRIDRCMDRQTAAVAALLPLAKKAQALQKSVPTA